MTRAALRGLLQRKLRALLTAFAVVLGVAMVSGTFMLTDSIEDAFDTVFETSYSGTDAVVSGRPIVEGATSGDPMVPASVLPTIRALPGVEAAAGGIGGDFQETSLTLATADGRESSTTAGQTLAVGVDAEHPRFIPLTLEAGAWPRGHEIVLDEGTVDQEHLAVGDTVTVGSEQGARPTASQASARSATSAASARPSRCSTCRPPRSCCERRASTPSRWPRRTGRPSTRCCGRSSPSSPRR